ncbi:hypothetical protein OESDEN_09408 [Oesophagostomum dentatum]|uniref:Mut7-C RNAse domain-containing protein n=1 Tax=Oesophagostomum dentatum TaxID=61180 RepID=A0A0B1SZP0_OESDE|nr:hypothetical protein OESDEN_09408 [Oesophagostomum dentatum]
MEQNRSHDILLLVKDEVPLKERIMSVYVNYSCHLGPYLDPVKVAGTRRKFGPLATPHALREAVQQLLNCSKDDGVVLNFVQPAAVTQILSVTVALTSLPLKQWTTNKVAEELRKFLDEQTVMKFVREQIDGWSLELLTVELLLSYMGIALGPALKHKMATTETKEEGKIGEASMEDMTWSEILRRLNDVESGTRPANELLCIVDTMLVDLGRNLRASDSCMAKVYCIFSRCGVNTLIPADQKELKTMAGGNERVILTTIENSDELKQLFADRVFIISNAKNLSPFEQLRQFFCEYKVSFAGLDNYSRCMECNGSAFVIAPAPVIQALFERHGIRENGFRYGSFDVDGWVQRLNSLDHRDYAGYGCRLLPPEEDDDDYMAVQCYGGIINITANMVIHDLLCDGVDVQIRKVAEQIVSRPGYVFYICGNCGRVYWEEH